MKISWNFKICSQYDTEALLNTDTDKELCDTETVRMQFSTVSLRTLCAQTTLVRGAAADGEGPEHSCSAETVQQSPCYSDMC